VSARSARSSVRIRSARCRDCYNPFVKLQAGAARLLRRIAISVRYRLKAAAGDAAPSAPVFEPGGSFPSVLHTRAVIAATFLRGDGIEIGALHQPLSVPASARVKYVDRMAVAELRRQYEPIAHEPFVETDIIDDGEQLTTIGDSTQDFVIANHFLEHCQNPIQTFQNLFRVLKPSGVLYLAVPDKRFTFDVARPCTTIEHIMRDFSEGPEWSKHQHFEEWSRLVNRRGSQVEVEQEVEHLLSIDYSIHYHVWRSEELLELIVTLQRLVQFELELFLRNGFETILILRKPAG
jgi:predicted SAM-dependent methyltransferase